MTREGIYLQEAVGIGEQGLLQEPCRDPGHFQCGFGIFIMMPGQNHRHQTADTEHGDLLLHLPGIHGKKTGGHDRFGQGVGNGPFDQDTAHGTAAESVQQRLMLHPELEESLQFSQKGTAHTPAVGQGKALKTYERVVDQRVKRPVLTGK